MQCIIAEISFFYRYAIGNAERPTLKSKVGWLDILANDTHQFYFHNNTGGPSIKVSPPHEPHLNIRYLKSYVKDARYPPSV